MRRQILALATAATLFGPAAAALAEPTSEQTFGYRVLLAQEPSPGPADRLRPPAKDPFTAAVFSAIFPGAGQLYNGQFWPKSVLILGGETLALTAVILGDQTYRSASAGRLVDLQNYSVGFYLGLASMVALYVYGIIDAYNSADDVNRKIEQDFGKAALLPLPPTRPLDNETIGVKWRFEL